jgi:phosphoglucomutase
MVESHSLKVTSVATTPYQDQKAGTSGLRKKVKVFRQEHYLENFVQSIFLSLTPEEYQGRALVIAGDGRFYNDVAIQIITRMAAAHGVKDIYVGLNGLISTPAASAIIRNLNHLPGGEGPSDVCVGAVLLTASHNPGGEDEDFGIKFNSRNGGPALESLTNKIYDHSKVITSYKTVEGTADVNLGAVNT